MSTIACTSSSIDRSPLRLLALLALVLAACTAAPDQPFSSAFTTGSSAPAASAGPLAADRIQILHTNDIHGRMEAETVRVGNNSFQKGGVAQLAGLTAQFRARAPDRTLLLDAGDAWQGAFVSNENRGAALVQVMDRMGYDAQALGNHDFDWGQDVLRARAGEATFPFLAANVVDETTGLVVPFAKPYIVKDLRLARVAVIGIANPGTPAINKPANVKGVRFLPAAETVRKYLPELRAQADIVVAVTHIGKDDDVALARAVPDIDVIVGGHSHTAIQTAILEGKTTIVQAGSYSEWLGHLELTIDPQTHAVTAAARGSELATIATGGAKPDAEVARIVADRAAAARSVTSRVVGKTLVALEPQSAGEFPLGDVIVDAMLDYCRAAGWGSDIALHNNSGVRSSIPAGDITYGQVYEVLPFDNVVVSIDLAGAQLRKIFERTVSGRPGNLLVAGGSYAFRWSADAGQRISSVTVSGAPLDPARTYHVCTIDYLALGGDDQTTFREGTHVIYGDLTAEVVSDYLTRHSPVSPKNEGRIVQQ